MTTELSGARAEIETSAGPIGICRLAWLAEQGIGDPSRLPRTVKILLENLLRRAGTADVSDDDVRALAAWPERAPGARLAFVPARMLMQDFTGVPALADLAAMRSAVARAGGDPAEVDPVLDVDLVIDHSLQVDAFGTDGSSRVNIEREYRRNSERYTLLRWAERAFDRLRVVPPAMGICHQVNLEHLSEIVTTRGGVAFPETVLGTDSHTTMVNGLGVLGWGVGGIEAVAATLGEPTFVPVPSVIGVRVTGELPTGATATDLVLTLTQMLRARGVVGRFIEFFGDGLSALRLADRATVSNMCPEYGATAAYFPVDIETLRYLGLTGRGDRIDLVERYTREQGLFREDGESAPVFDDVLELDLSVVEPSVAGPRRPQDRVPLCGVRSSFEEAFGARLPSGPAPSSVDAIGNGAVVIAAITSCTNTSNPSVMVAAGLLAKKAVELGLATKPWVKTSLAPGSRVVTDYLDAAGLTPHLERLGFALVGYGCTTCIGNSGPLADDVAKVVRERGLTVAAVLSGNRNFEGRIHPLVRASYLASPPLVVAYALAGHVGVDLSRDPIGTTPDGEPVRLADVWPADEEVREAIAASISVEQFEHVYGRLFDGDQRWNALPAPSGSVYGWDPASTYVQEPPFFQEQDPRGAEAGDIVGARCLVVLGDSVTTDHISPAGPIEPDSPAGRYLIERGVEPDDFNSYGSRRGNHHVMVRGTFGNVRLQNRLAPGTEGPWTVHLPDGERMTIYDAAVRYGREGVPLIVLAGKEYGSGSSRDWAAKGTRLLGVRAVIAESFERIHRSNLVGVGVLPLRFEPGSSVSSLGLTGRETFTITGLGRDVTPGRTATVTARRDDGSAVSFAVTVCIEDATEVEYYRHGGTLPLVLDRVRARVPDGPT
jgi:aconitate hydratase